MSHQKEGATMGSIEGIVALVIGIMVMLFVPALVWATVIAGMYQIVRGKSQQEHYVLTDMTETQITSP
jgi:hypothetical protein